MNVQVTPAKPSEKMVLARLLELYTYDFTEWTNQDINPDGQYGYESLERYFTEENRHPFFITVGGVLAGLALVNANCKYHAHPDAKHLAQFWVMRKYRKTGIGRAAAHQVFAMFQVPWEVRVLEGNTVAMAFWQQVIERYTQGTYHTHTEPHPDWRGIGYTFRIRTI